MFDAVSLDYPKVSVIVDATAAATPDVHQGMIFSFCLTKDLHNRTRKYPFAMEIYVHDFGWFQRICLTWKMLELQPRLYKNGVKPKLDL